MFGDAMIWLLVGLALGIALCMLILVTVALFDRRQIRRASILRQVAPRETVPEPARANSRPVPARAVVMRTLEPVEEDVPGPEAKPAAARLGQSGRRDCGPMRSSGRVRSRG